MKTTMATVIVFLIFAAGATASPVSIPWTDTVTHWPNYGGILSSYYNVDEDLIDVMGQPDITGGNINLDGRILNSVEMNFLGWTMGTILPGDLFWDNNGDGSWDYVLSVTLGKIYDIRAPGSFAYQMTSDLWGGADYRDNHPFAAINITGPAAGAGSYSLIKDESGNGTLTFAFTDPNFEVGNNFGFGFAPNCANDVVLVATPEPSSLLLLSGGLMALAGAFRKGRKR
jgi:hypothetical protein